MKKDSSKPAPLESLPAWPLSFRAKVFLVYAASALLLVFAVFVLGSYYINQLQKRNKQAAQMLAQEQVAQLKDKIAGYLNEKPGADLHQPTVRESLRPIIDITMRLNKNFVVAAVVDEDGNTVIEQTQGEEQRLTWPKAGTQKYSVDLSQQNGGKPFQLEFSMRPKEAQEQESAASSLLAHLPEIKQTIQQNGKQYGEIRLRLADSQTFQRIAETSRAITSALFVGCVLLFGVLLALFTVLWRMFARQLELMHKNERLDRMAYVGTLASGLAHEIRNPLSAMNVNLEVMREEIADVGNGSAERAANLATRVQREVTHLNSTLSSFLDFALPTREGAAPFSMRALVDELCEVHAEQMRQADIACDVVTVPADADLMVTADRRLVHQAIRNVLLNAIQVLAASVKKQLKIKVEATAGRRVRVAISDTGPGIEPENLPKIFDVFFSTRKGGSGFGLAIARKIIEEHGGTISAENNATGLGATFVIELPKEPARERRSVAGWLRAPVRAG